MTSTSPPLRIPTVKQTASVVLVLVMLILGLSWSISFENLSTRSKQSTLTSFGLLAMEPSSCVYSLVTTADANNVHKLSALIQSLLNVRRDNEEIHLYVFSTLSASVLLEMLLTGKVIIAAADTTKTSMSICLQMNDQLFNVEGSYRETIVVGLKHTSCGDMVLHIILSRKDSWSDWTSIASLYPKLQSVTYVESSYCFSMPLASTLSESSLVSGNVGIIMNVLRPWCVTKSPLSLFHINLRRWRALHVDAAIEIPINGTCEIREPLLTIATAGVVKYLSLEPVSNCALFRNTSQEIEMYVLSLNLTVGSWQPSIFSNPTWMYKFGVNQQSESYVHEHYLDSTSVPRRCSARQWRCLSSMFPMIVHSPSGMTCLPYRAGQVADGLLQSLVDNIVISQRSDGGWWKDSSTRHNYSTIDNGATVKDMCILGYAFERFYSDQIRCSFQEGIRFFINSQLENGCWPQISKPFCEKLDHLKVDYRCNIAFNDNAMINVLNFLWAASSGHKPFQSRSLLPDALHLQLTTAFLKGVRCLLQAQNLHNGMWASYYHRVTLQPISGRAFEPLAFSTTESAAAMVFLMRFHQFLATDAVSADARMVVLSLHCQSLFSTHDLLSRIHSSQSWFTKNALNLQQIDYVDQYFDVFDSTTVTNFQHWLWARFYDISSAVPLFGDRNRLVTTNFSAITQERRANYCWFNDNARPILCDLLPKWRLSTKQTQQPLPSLCHST